MTETARSWLRDLTSLYTPTPTQFDAARAHRASIESRLGLPPVWLTPDLWGFVSAGRMSACPSPIHPSFGGTLPVWPAAAGVEGADLRH